MSVSGSQMSARPPPKPKVLKPIDSSATLPARIIRSAQEICAAVLLLDGPEQAARLVEVHVVGPAVERRESLRAPAGAAAPIVNAVRAGGVPGHADEERSVVAEVRRPPVLRVGHQRTQVLDHRIQIELLELLGVVEFLVHGIGERGVLMQNAQVQLVGPPVAVAFCACRCVLDCAVRTGTLLR